MLDVMNMVDKRIEQMQKLYDRMDKTKSRIYNEPYSMLGFDGKAVDNVINVTMPYAPIFANAVISDLMQAVRQTVIEGDIPDKMINRIEGFLDDSRAQADELLRRRGDPPLFTWWCAHVCVRSIIGARWYTEFDNDTFRMYPLPLDMRWVPHEYGNDGLNWVCNRTFRTKDQIIAEYPESEGKFSGESDIEVRDYWNSEINEVYIGKSKIIERANPFEAPPFVIAAPATGFLLRDKGWLEHHAEDILYLIRDLYDEVNRQVSIEQTLGFESIRPPYINRVRENDGSPADPPPKTGQTKKAGPDEGWELLKRSDVNQAFIAARGDINRALQVGGINDIDIGNVSQQVSAVWITTQTGIRNKFTNPRLKCLAEAEQQLSRKMINQYQTLVAKGYKSEIELGETGRKRKYTAEQLGDPTTYSIEHRIMTQNKTQEVANWAIAQGAMGIAPERIILRDILMVDDPDEWIREKELEAAKKADPTIGLFEMALRFVDEADNEPDQDEADAKRIQSMILTDQGVNLIRQRYASQPLRMEQPKPNSQALMPLLGSGSASNQVVRPQRAEESQEAQIGQSKVD